MNVQRFQLTVLMFFVVTGLTAFQCPSKNNKISDMTNKIELDVDFRKTDSETLLIKYKITNKSKSEIILLNKGDSLSPAKAQAIYVEPQKDGTIEISRGGMPNAATPDRSPTFPVDFGITELKSNESFAEEFSVKLPLEPYSPFRSYTNNPIGMPETAKEIKLCFGTIDEKVEIKSGDYKVLKNYTDLVKQKIICSKTYKMSD